MKTRSFVLGLFAFAALCACNKEAQPAAPEVLDADTYVKVNIMATPATRADYELGEGYENDVYNGLFLFYDGDDHAVEASGFTWNPGTDGENVAKSATIKFPANANKPTSMLVILNYDPAKETTYKSSSLTEVKNLLAESLTYSVGSPATQYYTMTNAVYTNDDTNTSDTEDVICEVALTDANFGKTGTAEGEADAAAPVNVYVERVAAKVLLDNQITSIAGKTIEFGGSKEVVPVVVGYEVVETPEKGYLFKKVDPSWDYTGWTKPGDYRSFWASSPALVDPDNYAYIAYKDYTEHTDPIYVFENTTATTTKVVLAAKLQIAGVDADLVRYNNTYYSLADFKTLAADAVNSVLATSYAAGDLEVVWGKGNADLTNNYEIVLQHASDTDANDILKKMTAMYWNGGRCYYYTEIKHDIPAQAGVVRNHVYKLTFKSIEGMGIPVPSEDLVIDPETMSEEYYSLNATVNILQWRVVEQEVNFNN